MSMMHTLSIITGCTLAWLYIAAVLALTLGRLIALADQLADDGDADRSALESAK